MSEKFDFVCLGSMDCYPKAGNDSSAYVIDGHILIDTSYSTVCNLLNCGIDPLAIDTIIFTHLHADHYMGLSQFLYYFYGHGCKALDGRLTIITPPDDFDAILEASIEYFRHDAIHLSIYNRERIGNPTVIKLPERGTLSYGEYEISYIPSVHAVPGRCYMIKNGSGRTIGFSGDTTYFPELETFFSGADALVFENSYFNVEHEPNQFPGHCSAHDAGRVAAAANVGRLLLVHSRMLDRQSAMECAANYYKGEISYPVLGTKERL